MPVSLFRNPLGIEILCSSLMDNNRAPANRTPIEKIVRPFQEFAELESSAGILLIACTVVALLWANSPWANSYFHLWHIEIMAAFGGGRMAHPLHFWINDGLMALFFLLVGLEIKREMLVGELASFGKAALPIAGAVGGMLVPAGFYVLCNHGRPGAAGWGIPVATDIAFALGLLALLGDRVPGSLKVFLAALAIVDDIGAVLVIAFFYTEQISWTSLGVAGLFFIALIVANRSGARNPLIYVILGLGLWLAFLHSGIHATVAGVLLAATIPARGRIDGRAFLSRSQKNLDEFRCAEEPAARSTALHQLVDDCAAAEAPMLRFEHALAPWIKHFVMPIFALANAGVVLSGGAVRELARPLGLGILCGLILGKPIGIVFFSWLATKTRLATMLQNIGWLQIAGVGILGGVGFTMSLFVANLAFAGTPQVEAAKMSILVASILAGAAGMIVLARQKSSASH
jgi:NhaA family Na+:H+ antiporter